MMKLRLIGLCAVLLTAWTAQAQVAKQVEVTKAYVPSLEPATKLHIAPDMTDTTQLRPEIDYTVTPLSLETSLSTRPIRPATVTYWEFNRPQPFFLKAGIGYPLQSVLEFNASTQNPGTGYALGYLQHEGRFGRVKNDFGVKNYATRMMNRVGGAAGLYWGRRVVEADLNYRLRRDCRYGMYYPKGSPIPGDKLHYSDANFAVRLGDDFLNLQRFNFEVALLGSLFMDNSDPLFEQHKSNQMDLGANLRMARAWRSGRFDVRAAYRLMDGRKGLKGYDEQLLMAGLSYGVTRSRLLLEVGADFYHDRIRRMEQEREAENYILPELKMEWSLARKALKPFVNLESGFSTNDFRSLTEENPYLLTALWGAKPTIDYDLKAGLKGSFGRDRFAYRLYVQLLHRRNHNYWVMPVLHAAMPTHYFGGWMTLCQDDLSAAGLGGELSYRPTTSLLFEVSALLRSFEEEGALPVAQPELTGAFGMRYEHPKFRLGVRAAVMSERAWAYVSTDAPYQVKGRFESPFAVDVQLDFEWIFSPTITGFVEGRNLANQSLYRFANYPEYGIHALVGVKMSF